MTVSMRTEGPVAIVTIDNPPVNAVSQAVRQGLVDAVATTESAADIRAVVLICAGKTFVAGADVREFGKPPVEPHLPDVILALEGTSKPWIAAIQGSALGGGLEIAMGCHYRIADKAARFGLPEVLLGLIPGAGGTVRLPRIVNVATALAMMANGKPMTAQAALQNGLVDAVVDAALLDEARRLAEDVMTSALPVPILKRALPKYDADAIAAQMRGIAAKARGQNSPVAICEAVQNTLILPADVALAVERTLFLSLKEDPQSFALRHIFFAERATGKSLVNQGEVPPSLHNVGVVGGGTMGAGIAAACLLKGLHVTMIERNADALSAGQARVLDVLGGSLKRGLVTAAQHQEITNQLEGSTQYSALSDVDLVIEAVFEDMDVKHQVFRALDTATKPEAVLASNTSYLDIKDIAAVVSNPSRVIGLHFFSPAHVMRLLELVVPDGASALAVATGAALGKKLGKITVPSGVCDGFIGNRVMSAYRRACDYMVEDGAMPHDVDAAMRDFGFPMGIYEMQDLAGLDISWAMRKRRAAGRDSSERYVDIADRLCEAGRFGRKNGQGWYGYDGKTPLIDPIVTALILAESKRKSIIRRSFSAKEIMNEILIIMQSEGAAILAEGIAGHSDDIDVVMVNGYGFPRWRGGPMFLRG
jgi:3-hydroxyacyl-CoA dehydrogenase